MTTNTESTTANQQSAAAIQPAASRPLLGVLTAVAVNLILTPVYGFAGLMLAMSADSYYVSGKGGPLAHCSGGPPICTGPDYPQIALMTFVILAGLFLAGLAGQKAGDFANKWRVVTVFALSGLAIGLLGGATFYLVIL